VFHYHIHLIPSSIHELGRHAAVMADQEQLANLAKQLAAVIDAK
jgi:histidine triad (HIT) family protein